MNASKKSVCAELYSPSRRCILPEEYPQINNLICFHIQLRNHIRYDDTHCCFSSHSNDHSFSVTFSNCDNINLLFQHTSTFPYNSHDERMCNRALNLQRCLIKLLQFFIIFLTCVHLNFEGVYLQQLSAYNQIPNPSTIILTIPYDRISTNLIKFKCKPFRRSSLPSTFWQLRCSCLRILASRGHSSLSRYNFPSFVFVLNHNLSFFASLNASNVTWRYSTLNIFQIIYKGES